MSMPKHAIASKYTEILISVVCDTNYLVLSVHWRIHSCTSAVIVCDGP